MPFFHSPFFIGGILACQLLLPPIAVYNLFGLQRKVYNLSIKLAVMQFTGWRRLKVPTTTYKETQQKWFTIRSGTLTSTSSMRHHASGAISGEHGKYHIHKMNENFFSRLVFANWENKKVRLYLNSSRFQCTFCLHVLVLGLRQLYQAILNSLPSIGINFTTWNLRKNWRNSWGLYASRLTTCWYTQVLVVQDKV